MIQISDLLKGKGGQVWSIDASASLQDALRLLAKKDVGALPVLKDGKLVGIFSERDFVRAVSNNPSLPLETPVSELMTKDVLTVSPSDSVERCMKLMTKQHIRHLPVVEGDKMVGIVSIGDAVKLFVTDRESFIRQLEDYISGRW
ncbi:MAG: CBS domain-containing protein [Anaerolineaceae bacterium]|jgi:CBS domain-containing protein|nr:CBS domain-containing protein [Anaerolineaceae bacterium]